MVYLGTIYYKEINIYPDINKPINYLILDANGKNQEALLFHGLIYPESKNILYNINKAINYFTIAANQNNPNALCKILLDQFISDFII